MLIEVLGTGCTKCAKLFNNVSQAVTDTGLDARVVKIEKIDEIMKRGVMLTPGLVIDGKVVSSGRLLKPADIVKLLQATAKKA